MKKTTYSVETDGFYGAYYETPKVRSDCAVILMLGDAIDDRMALSGAKWLLKLGCNVMTMAPAKKDYGHHNYPLERFGRAIEVLRSRGNRKFGIAGASTTGMAALVAASYYTDLTLTIAISPSDFVMEGYYQDGMDGAHERPGDHESTLSLNGEPLPYLPFAYRHPEYWQMLHQEAKEGGDLVASRRMFDRSEELHPLQEEEKIKVERIRGRIVLIGAEDDVLWDTVKYIRRMEERLAELPHESTCRALVYEHGTHFAFPESMLRQMLPLGADLLPAVFRAGRKFPRECKATRLDIDRNLKDEIAKWRDAKMKPNYANWMPKGMIAGFGAATVGLTAACVGTALLGRGKGAKAVSALCGAAAVGCGAWTGWCVKAYRAFSYDGKRQLSRQIVEGTAEHISLPIDGVGLDVGCGSGALTIACAKRNPQASMLGVDPWGPEYASFSKSLCESNAQAEGVANVSFRSGNAISLPFPDESFDAVTSNYVYHNITGRNKQELLLETLRVLKKGGCFAIHDIMSPARYGDMNAFVEHLRAMGYEQVELIDTTDGLFMTPGEARSLFLTGSTLLVGRK